ncbi:MAG: hypothetical protein IKU79_03920 [Bacteroidaceae bacterium]|nr:hypothetical protein [Bacteroidaceae bacterium]
MKVIFTSETKEDFRKHNDYVQRLNKSDGHKYQSYELKGINKSFKKNLKDNLEKIKTPKDSIFPKEFEYSSDSHKMYVDKMSHYVVFYTVETTKSGEKIMKVRRNIHSTELKKELEEKGIKPLKDCDKSLLDDLETVYKEDDVKLKDDSEDEKETQEEVTDPDTGRKIKKVKHVGKRGGKYYIDDNGNKVYPEEWNESIIDLKTKILESKIVSLVDYLKRMIG